MTKLINTLKSTLKQSNTCPHRKIQILEGTIKSLFEHHYTHNLQFNLDQKIQIKFLKDNLTELELWSSETKFSPLVFMCLGTICEVVITEDILLPEQLFKEYTNYFKHQILPKNNLDVQVRVTISQDTVKNVEHYCNNAWKTNNWELIKFDMYSIIKYIYLLQNYQITLAMIKYLNS